MTTTTTEPLIDEPSIDVSELPALDQPDERVCELMKHGGRCGAPASWIAYIVHDGCGHPPVVRLVCDQCRDLVLRCPEGDCGKCARPTARVRALEPLRSPP